MARIVRDLKPLGGEEQAWLKAVIERAVNRSRIKSPPPPSDLRKLLTPIRRGIEELIRRLSAPNEDLPTVRRTIADALAPIVASDQGHPPVIPDQGLMLFLGKDAPSYERLSSILDEMVYFSTVLKRANPKGKGSKPSRTAIREQQTWILWSLIIIWERLMEEKPHVERPVSFDRKLRESPFVKWVKTVGQVIRLPFADYLIEEVVNNPNAVLGTSLDAFLEHIADKRYPLQ